MKSVQCASCGEIHEDIICPHCKSVVSIEPKEKENGRSYIKST